MFRRKRRRSGVWLPPDPYDRVGQPDDVAITVPTQSAWGKTFLTLDAEGAAGGGNAHSIALVGDFSQNIIAGVHNPVAGGYANAGSLDDLTFGYSLKRVVGNLFLTASQSENSAVLGDSCDTFLITAGIIVRRVNEAGSPTALNLFPDSYDAYRDPWLWRRSWVLTNLQQATVNQSGYTYPDSNFYFQGSASNHHVDQKTRRTLKAEERLFLDISGIRMWTGSGAIGAKQDIAVLWDLRFFGRVFQSAGNRRNAVR